MNSPTPPSLPHFSLALEVLAHLPLADYDLLARELNVYSDALRSRGGRTSFSAGELQTLFLRMWDVGKIAPAVLTAHPVDLDAMSKAVEEKSVE